MYLNDDDRACLARGADAAGMKRGPYARALMLYRAGWAGYSGPLFGAHTAVEDVELHQAGDVLHETLRTLRELATTIAAIYNKLGARPSAHTVKMLVALAMFVSTFKRDLGELRRFPDAAELEIDLLALATRLRPHHGLAAEQIQQTADLVGTALQQPKGNDSGKAEKQKAGR